MVAKVASEAGLWYNNLNKIMFCPGGTGHTPRRELHLLGGVTMDSLYLFPPDDKTPEKTCKGPCGRALPATPEYFYRNKGTKDGLVSTCKQCRSKSDKAFYDENAEQKRASARKYYEDHRDERTEYNTAYRESRREELRQYARKYVKEHHEEVLRKGRQYYTEHREERADYRAKHYRDNRESIIDRSMRYYRTERGRFVHQISGRNRRSRKRQTPGTLTPEQIQAKLKAQKYRCYYAACGHAKFQKKDGKYIYHLEHTIPISRTEHNPRNDINYVVLSCPSCNLSKKDKLPHEWTDGGRLC